MSDAIARYYYDANGARAKTDESGTIDSYVYAGHDPLLHIAADGRSDKYLNLGGKLEVRQITGSESYVYIADALGSTRKVLRNGDSAQVTFSATAYMPFGKACGVTGSDEVTFAGETLDSSTGLVYLSARYYDPELGRFYALDPELGKLSMPQTLNRYAYCMNNPLRYTDPSGRFPFILIIILAVGITGAAIEGGNAALNNEDVLSSVARGFTVWTTFAALCYVGVPPWLSASFCGGTDSAWRTAEKGGSIGDIVISFNKGELDAFWNWLSFGVISGTGGVSGPWGEGGPYSLKTLPALIAWKAGTYVAGWFWEQVRGFFSRPSQSEDERALATNQALEREIVAEEMKLASATHAYSWMWVEAHSIVYGGDDPGFI